MVLFYFVNQNGENGYANNEYHLLSLDNPEIYRDLNEEADELPLFIGEDFPA